MILKGVLANSIVPKAALDVIIKCANVRGVFNLIVRAYESYNMTHKSYLVKL